jgi:hypothetical protein
MKVIVAGSRGFYNFIHQIKNLPVEEARAVNTRHRDILYSVLNKLLKGKIGVTIISGAAAGADAAGEEYAFQNCLQLISKPADWDTHGKSAGYKRNAEMAEIATHCVIFWDGSSKGSKHMLDIAKSKKLPTVLVHYNEVPLKTEFFKPD